MTGAWGGHLTRKLTPIVLFHKGDTCHLCGLPGADSPDHDPPRSTLIRMGVPDPDHLDYLWPAHFRPCNNLRRNRDITDDLKAECRTARLASLGLDTPTPNLSPRFQRRRPQTF